MLALSQPEEAKRLLELAQQDVVKHFQFYQQLASLDYGGAAAPGAKEKE